jgi:hypothetical protein
VDPAAAPVSVDPVAVITAVTALVVALGALTTAIVRLHDSVAKTHTLVNSRMDELLALTRESSRAAGRLEGPMPPASP